MAQLQLRPHRSRSTRSRRNYREPHSETDLENGPRTSKPRPARSSRRVQNYCEQSSSDDNAASTTSHSDSESSVQSRQQTSGTQRVERTGVRRSTRAKSERAGLKTVSAAQGLNSFKRRKLGHSQRNYNKMVQEPGADAGAIPVNTQAPPWQHLEYDILLKIMQCAAYPLYSSTFRIQHSVEWLVAVSRLCKSFHQAAIAALLWEPPLLPIPHAHGLISLLSQEQEFLSMNYGTKIRSLNVEVKNVLVKKLGINIESLIKLTPLLTRLRIYHWHDEMVGKAIWAEPAVSHFKWSYGTLFDCLDKNNIRLKSFEWNGRFQDTALSMPQAHEQKCLTSLEELSIVNFNFTDKQENDRSYTRDIIMRSLSSVMNLKRLEIRNCNFLDLPAMKLLPLQLRSLKIVNCLSLTCEGLASYLTLGGSSLETLHLEGNQVMDLGFMPKLSETCPRLENLHIDLSYEDCSSYRDRNPLYDELLPNGSPTWPSTLISIVVGPLRSLDVSDAEDFYTSLINAADSLPYLRILSIKTILNDASWRDRASLRTKWRPLFEKVFAINKTYSSTVTKPKPEPPTSSQRKSARLQELDELSISEETDSAFEVGDVILNLPRQNRCELVEFELSDQRPAQEQFREDDFLDSEPSDDGEWNGRDEPQRPSRYAW